jgi:hypothetical protein
MNESPKERGKRGNAGLCGSRRAEGKEPPPCERAETHPYAHRSLNTVFWCDTRHHTIHRRVGGREEG